MKSLLQYIIVILVVGGIISCSDEPTLNLDEELLTGVKHAPGLISDLREESKDKVVIGNHSYVLKAYLWRDFMPVNPPDGKPLISINTLVNQDSAAIPSEIEMKQQYVIYNDSLWVTDYTNEVSNDPEYELERISRSGPKWGPNVKVDVISKINNVDTRKTYLLIVEDQNIERVE
ncbi:MAG: hypothetical protein K9I94_06260 [Bacteroidales bacterium]|nr:hypothetical protein [Bacteroidales bacterium]